MKTYEVLDLTDPGVVVGRHAVWLPKQQIKVPFQWGGQIQKYQHPEEATYPLALVGEEVAMLRSLARERIVPPIGEWVYFKTVVSDHLGGWWADPCGAYGYEMADAGTLPRGAFEGIDGLQASGLISGSPGAWNDLLKPGNTMNGYLLDTHRSGWDRLRWDGPAGLVPTYTEDRIKLKTDLLQSGSFPFRERDQPYQEYFLDGRWWPGEREVVKRAALLQYQVSPGETVLDIGTCLGGFLTRGYQRAYGKGRFIGLDTQAEYVDLARRLARANGFNICFRQMNVAESGLMTAAATGTVGDLMVWLGRLQMLRLRRVDPERGDVTELHGPDHLLLLSMLKHFPGGEADIWGLVDRLRPRWTYLETNAVKEGVPAPLGHEVARRGGAHVGWSHDRNRRACYRVGRRAPEPV